MRETIEKVRSFLFARQEAYVSVFDKNNKHAEKVLADLAKFCRATKPTFQLDPRQHALLEGRREVWLRIQNHLNLSSEELWKLLDGRNE